MRLFVLLAALLASGCAMSPTQQKWAGFIAGAVIVGMIAAHDDSDPALTVPKDKSPIVPCGGDPRFCK